jgi:hypothetical protein
VRDVCDPQLQRARATEVSSARTSTHTHTHTRTQAYPGHCCLMLSWFGACLCLYVCACVSNSPGRFFSPAGVRRSQSDVSAAARRMFIKHGNPPYWHVRGAAVSRSR